MEKWGKLAMIAGLAVAVASAGQAPAAAQSGAEVIKERRALMKDNSSNVKAVVAFVKKGQGSAADVGIHARKIAANAARIPDLFPKGTSLEDGVGETGAKPAIWQERAKFEAAAAGLSKAAWELSAAAGRGDKKAIGAMIANFGKVACGSCHQPFRKKLK